MAGYLLCISFESGVPIFARKIGDIAPIPFPLAASMNGVKVFGKANRVELISTLTESSRVIWKDYHSRITLIYAGTDDTITDIHVDHLLETIFNAIVLHVGIDHLKTTKNLDRLKKDCRRCYSVIDKILQGLKPTEKAIYFGDLTRCVDVSLHSEFSTQAQAFLDTFLESVGCSYGCILNHGSIAAASKEWWAISGEELCLISFCASEVPNGFFDMIIYLPITSPKLPFRLVVFKLSEGVRLCLVCGQDPPFPIIEKEMKKARKSGAEIFHLCEEKGALLPHVNPFPHYARFFAIEKSLSGFLLVNVEKKRVAFSVFSDRPGESLSTAQKLDILRTFYRNIVGPCFPLDSPLSPDSLGEIQHQPLESYWASDFHKCHALRHSSYQLFLIYDAPIPTYLMRVATQKLLSEIIKDKIIK